MNRLSAWTAPHRVIVPLTARKDTMRIFLTMCQNVWRSLFSGNLSHLRKHAGLSGPELQSEFVRGATAEEDIGPAAACLAAQRIKGSFRGWERRRQWENLPNWAPEVDWRSTWRSFWMQRGRFYWRTGQWCDLCPRLVSWELSEVAFLLFSRVKGRVKWGAGGGLLCSTSPTSDNPISSKRPRDLNENMAGRYHSIFCSEWVQKT